MVVFFPRGRSEEREEVNAEKIESERQTSIDYFFSFLRQPSQTIRDGRFLRAPVAGVEALSGPPVLLAPALLPGPGAPLRRRRVRAGCRGEKKTESRRKTLRRKRRFSLASTHRPHLSLDLDPHQKQNQQQHRLAIIHLRSEENNNVKAVELAAWVPPAAVTCTAAAQIASSSLASTTTTTLLAAGCADGSLCRLRVSFPRGGPGGATIADTKLNEEDFDVADLVPWRRRLHSGAITSVAVPSGSGGGGEPSSSAAVATSGSDGSIVLTPLFDGGSSSRVLVPARPAASVSAIAWCSGSEAGGGLLAACGSAAPVELFDVRSQGGRPVARAAAAANAPPSSDASLLCVHPARPNLVATGGRKGIALWDLRFLGKGAAASIGGERPSSPSSSSPPSFSPLLKGGVTGLAFDPLPSVGLSDQTPRLLFCTGAGVVGSARLPPAGRVSDATLLYKEAGASALALAVEPSDSNSMSSGRDVFVSTDQECLIYMQRPLV